MSRLRLAELPFLAATLAMALTLALPWAFGGPVEDGRQVVAASTILPWVAPESGAAVPFAGTPLQLAGQASDTPEGVTRQ